MSYIVSEVYEAFIASSDLRRAPGGVRFIAVLTVVLLASLLTAVDEGQSRPQQPSAQAGGESPGTKAIRPELPPGFESDMRTSMPRPHMIPIKYCK